MGREASEQRKYQVAIEPALQFIFAFTVSTDPRRFELLGDKVINQKNVIEEVNKQEE